MTQRHLTFDTHTTGIRSKQKELRSVAKQFQGDLHPRHQHASCAKSFQMRMHDQGGFIVVAEWYGGRLQGSGITVSPSICRANVICGSTGTGSVTFK